MKNQFLSPWPWRPCFYRHLLFLPSAMSFWKETEVSLLYIEISCIEVILLPLSILSFPPPNHFQFYCILFWDGGPRWHAALMWTDHGFIQQQNECCGVVFLSWKFLTCSVLFSTTSDRLRIFFPHLYLFLLSIVNFILSVILLATQYPALVHHRFLSFFSCKLLEKLGTSLFSLLSVYLWKRWTSLVPAQTFAQFHS